MATTAAKRISPGIYEVNGKRINAVNEEEALKKSGIQKGAPAPAATKPPKAAVDPLSKVPKTIDNVTQGVQAEKTVADVAADTGIKYANPNQVDATGNTRTTSTDANGNPVITDTLDSAQKDILDKDAKISSMGRDYAMSLAGSSGLDKAFDPTLDPRTSTGDLVADRKRQEGELSDYLSRDFATKKAQDRNDFETSLYNRGIPLDPQNEAYKRAETEFNDNWNSKEADVRAEALQFGGTEMDRSFSQGEQRRANQLSEQTQVRGQRLGEVGAWAGLGTGVQGPNFGPAQGVDYSLSSPVEIDQALKAGRISAQQAKTAMEAVRKAGSGGGGGGSGAGKTAIETSPFVDG